MDFNEWLKLGMESNWCRPVVCETHDGLPMSEQENEEFWESDPCIHIIRLYEDEDHAKAVEDAHSPSVWRKPYSQ
jgi:hypothetical protein